MKFTDWSNPFHVHRYITTRAKVASKVTSLADHPLSAQSGRRPLGEASRVDHDPEYAIRPLFFSSELLPSCIDRARIVARQTNRNKRTAQRRGRFIHRRTHRCGAHRALGVRVGLVAWARPPSFVRRSVFLFSPFLSFPLLFPRATLLTSSATNGYTSAQKS